MKPKDFKLENFEKTKPFLKSNLFYIPKIPSSFDWSTHFNNMSPCVIEYCSGNGSWITEKALKESEKNFIAVEKRFDRVKKIISKCTNLSLKNILVVWGEALTFTKFYVNPETISEIYINFPDPWPKRRHEKNRLLNGHFVQELDRVLKKEGNIILATDDQRYAESSLCSFRKNPNFDSHFVDEMPGYGSSFFDSLWREKGKSIFYIKIKK